MEWGKSSSRKKLYIGFGLLGTAVLGWSVTVIRLMGSAQAAMRSHSAGDPSEMMSSMAIGYAVCGLLAIAGMIVTVMGLIEYAAERRTQV